MLVALRVTIGWHFLYEGVWKIVNADEFSAEPFLTMAKGPPRRCSTPWSPISTAGAADDRGKDDKGKDVITGKIYLDAWKGQLDAAVGRSTASTASSRSRPRRSYEKYARSRSTEYLAENQDDIVAYFGSLDRFEEPGPPAATTRRYQKKRDWDQQQKLRGEVERWLGESTPWARSTGSACGACLNDDQKALGPIPAGWTAVEPDGPGGDLRPDGDRAVHDAGLLHAAGVPGRGGVPGLRAADAAAVADDLSAAPEVVGHALVVDKNFVEMVAMFMLAVCRRAAGEGWISSSTAGLAGPCCGGSANRSTEV